MCLIRYWSVAWVWGSSRCVLNPVVTVGSGTKCSLCPVFCAGWLLAGISVSFADFCKHWVGGGGQVGASFCPQTSCLMLKTGKGVIGQETVPSAGCTGIHQLQRRILFFEDVKIFHMYLEILWRISGFQVY